MPNHELGGIGDGARENQDRNAEDDAWDHQRRQHQEVAELLQRELVALEKERGRGADEERQRRLAAGDQKRVADAAQDVGVVEQAELRLAVVEEPGDM